jgi:drug/metabolite transporter (DMT)-like permease
MNTKATGILYAFAALFLFGTTYPVNKMVTNSGVDPMILSFARALLGALFLYPFYLRLGKTTRWTPREWKLACLIGLGMLAAAMTFEIAGTRLTTASNASLIVSLESLLSIILAVLLLKERLPRSIYIGALLSFSGTGLIMYQDIQHLEWHWGSALVGEVFLLLAVLSWSLFTVLSKPLNKHVHPFYAIFFILCLASVSLAIISLLFGDWSCLEGIGVQTWLGILYLGIAGTGVPHLCYYQALKRLMASTVSLCLTLIPLIGVILSYLMLGERLSLRELLGGALIISGVFYVVRNRIREGN